ncbi:hypothetical protein RHGRI_025167 [Rhododendron griersonianum]|uniref:Uncharacterized protein n=1 Tax=Rhododendron griersonianum TaxID=479676 RepID=A0AAV6J9X1_9ERIC|nr:hypothetical protein RHGRI_025167 [Rhododendron griersonianum]
MTDGGQTVLQGNLRTTTSLPLSSISTYTPLGSPRPLPFSAETTDLIEGPKITILTKPTITSSPGPDSSPSSPSNKPYFVTEPSDSPKASYPGPSAFEPLQTPQLNLTSPFLIQPKPPKPPNLDVPLSSIFNSLSLKRKSTSDLDDPSHPKLLRLCAPNPDTNPKPSHPHNVPNPLSHVGLPKINNRYITRSRNRKSPSGPKNKGMADLDSKLVEVLVSNSSDMELEASLVPLSTPPTERVVVADPKQPPAQC